MSIFNFKDYRPFLKDYIKKLPQNGRGQVNKIADFIGVNSTLVSQVLGGYKDFTIEQAHVLSEYLGLSEIETDYFLLLVQLERAGTKKLKDHFRKKINEVAEASLNLKNRVAVDRKLSDHERAVFYSSWLYSAVRLFCSLGDGKTIDEICDRFLLERSRGVEILQFLTETNLCVHEGAVYKLNAQKTHLEQGSPFLARHYSNWRVKAIQRSENLEKKELMFTAPFSVSKADFELLREDFLEAIQKLYKRVGDTDPEEVACVNVDLFWVK